MAAKSPEVMFGNVKIPSYTVLAEHEAAGTLTVLKQSEQKERPHAAVFD